MSPPTLISSDQFGVVRDSAIRMLSDAFPKTPIGDIVCYEYLLFHFVFHRDRYSRNEHYTTLLHSVSVTQRKSENQTLKSNYLPTHHHSKRQRRIQKHHRTTSVSSDSVLNSSLSDSDVSGYDLASAMLVMDGLDNNDNVINEQSNDGAPYSENSDDDDENNDIVVENNSDVEDENECDDDDGQVNDNGDIGSDSGTDGGDDVVDEDNDDSDDDDSMMERVDAGVDDNDNDEHDDDTTRDDDDVDTERDIVMNRSKYVKSYKRDRPKRFYSLYRTLVRMSCCEVSSWSLIHSAIHTRPYHWFHHDIHFASPVFTHAKRKHAQRIQKHLDTDRRFNEPNCFLYQCGKCKCFATKVTKSQTRSADEPETQFVQCVTCQNRWCIK